MKELLDHLETKIPGITLLRTDSITDGNKQLDTIVKIFLPPKLTEEDSNLLKDAMIQAKTKGYYGRQIGEYSYMITKDPIFL